MRAYVLSGCAWTTLVMHQVVLHAYVCMYVLYERMYVHTYIQSAQQLQVS